jgi:DNA-binding transcriptional regulator/RsmH inhibitor MraZ
MTEKDDPEMWTPAAFARQFQQSSEDAVERQMELFERFTGANGSGFDGFSGLGSMSMGTAVFKTRVQSGGRISIPDAEREALGIDEGDIVQTVVIPLKKHED